MSQNLALLSPGAELDERVARAVGWRTDEAGGWIDAYGERRCAPTFSSKPKLTPELIFELNKRGHKFSFDGNTTTGITATSLNVTAGAIGVTGHHALALLALMLLDPQETPADHE